MINNSSVTQDITKNNISEYFNVTTKSNNLPMSIQDSEEKEENKMEFI